MTYLVHRTPGVDLRSVLTATAVLPIELAATYGNLPGEPLDPRGNAETTRALLLDTAADLMRRIGLLHTTTKRIASEAGYSEATLYKHFPGKAELVLAVLRHRFPPFVEDLAALPDRAGSGSVAQNLTGVVAAAVPFFRHGAPILGSLFAEPGLLRRHWEEMESHGVGPLGANRAVAS